MEHLISLRSYRQVLLAIACMTMISWEPSQAQDTQWRGPARDGKYPAKGLLKEWPESGPDLILLKEDLGKGYSTPILYEGEIYISGIRDSLDVLTKLDLQGNILWETAYGKAWENTYPESRNTPTIQENRVYIMGGMGTVACMDTESGEIIWSVNTHEQFDGEFHRWGMAESLLLVDDMVISSPVGSETAVVALHKEDGSLLWKTASMGGQRSYASPLLIEHHGRRMILVISSEDIMAVKPDNGRIIWDFDLVEYSSRGRRNNTNTPLYHNGSIFITSGYDDTSVMLDLSSDGNQVEVRWTSDVLDTHHGGVVLLDGYLYGSNWINNGNGNWVCQEWDSGRVMYEEKWHNKGSMIYADGMLYVYEEKQGNVGLVKPDPKGLEVISTFRVTWGTGPHWAHMSIYDQMLFIRHGEVLMVYDIAAAK